MWTYTALFKRWYLTCFTLKWNAQCCSSVTSCRGGGGTDLERGYGDVWPWRPPFQASPVARKGPISSKRVSSQDPLLRKFENFSLNSLNFHLNFSSQAPKFGNFQLTSPQIWKFSAHQPPNLELFCSQAPLFRGKCHHTSEIRAAHPYLKKSWVPPPPRASCMLTIGYSSFTSSSITCALLKYLYLVSSWVCEYCCNI